MKPKQPKALWTKAFPHKYKPKAAKPRKWRYGPSKAQAKRLREYQKESKAWKAGKQCFCWAAMRNEREWVCQPEIHPARDIHHVKGRGKYLMDKTTWLAVCRTAHRWIHDHPAEAKARGWMESRA